MWLLQTWLAMMVVREGDDVEKVLISTQTREIGLFYYKKKSDAFEPCQKLPFVHRRPFVHHRRPGSHGERITRDLSAAAKACTFDRTAYKGHCKRVVTTLTHPTIPTILGKGDLLETDTTCSR